MSKEIQGQIRSKFTDMYKSGKGHKAISLAFCIPVNHTESHDAMKKTWISDDLFPGGAGLQISSQECTDGSSKRL